MKIKTNSIVTFLTAKTLKFDTIKTNATARKIDSKDKAENAQRFLSVNSKETSGLNEFIENFKTRLFTDVKTVFGQFIGKDILVEILIENNFDVFQSLPCFEKTQKSLVKRFNCEISDVDFLTALKTAFTNHEKRINKSKTAKLAGLSEKAKKVFSGKEKQNFVVLLAKLEKELKAEKAKGQKA